MSESSRPHGIRRRDFLKAAAGASLATFVPWSIQRHAFAAPARVSEIRIGGVHPLAGPAAFHGRAESRGIQLAIEEANAAGGIKSMRGARLVWMPGDSQGSVATGVSEAERLIRQGAHVLTGLQSDIMVAVTQVGEREKTPSVVGLSIIDHLTSRGFRYTFRVGGNTVLAAQGSIAALQGIAQRKGLKLDRIAMIRNDQEFASSLGAHMQIAVRQAGLEMVGIVEYPLASADLTNEVQRLRALRPSVVLTASLFTDGLLFARTVAQLRADFPVIWGTLNAAFGTPQLVRELGANANYLYDNNWSLNPKSPSTEALAAKIRARFSGDEMIYTHMYGYVIGKIIVDALERAGSDNKEAIREALAATEYSTDLFPWEGPVKFDRAGQNLNIRATTTQILDGNVRVVWPPKAANAEPVLPVPAWSQRR